MEEKFKFSGGLLSDPCIGYTATIETSRFVALKKCGVL